MSSISSSNQERYIALPVTIDEYFRSYRLDELKKYLDITEKYLKTAEDDFKARVDKETEILSRENLSPGEINDILSDEYWRYSERFPRIFRNSFLVSAISLLEHELNLICNRLKKEQNIRINLSDLTGDTLERTKKYFQNAGLELPFSDPSWQEINNYYMVRNCIVHNNGLIQGVKGERALRSYISRKKIISEDTIKEEIALTPEFCREVVETIQVFLVELEKSMHPESKE